MIYKSLKECVLDLEKNGHLISIEQPVDPYLEMAHIHRRVFAAGGPALFFKNVKNSQFPAVSNLFGTMERSRFIFRSTLESVKTLVRFKADPVHIMRNLKQAFRIPRAAFNALPKKMSSGPVYRHRTDIKNLPMIQCWPKDGGAFILLPQVYSEKVYSEKVYSEKGNSENLNKPGIFGSNLGMYRIQISGNDYKPGREIGLHYQIRRDIGIHHTDAVEKDEPLKISIFAGGPPAHTFAAVMPLPEGLPEVAFAGAMAGRRFRYLRENGYCISADADFCITGTVSQKETKPEGPFGDHLGYYSLKHEFPYIRVESVWHRQDAVWPFTVVGRPPQEDTAFGKLIHEITGPMVPVSMPGITAVHAVDAAGVHPLLLAIGKERYTPYKQREPEEILTLANAVLGFGHCSLAKYLMICAEQDNPDLDIHDIKAFFTHILERVDWRRDLHFQTRTTIDTLDYSGTGMNTGSKVVIAAAGRKKRNLCSNDSRNIPVGFDLLAGFKAPRIVMPGIMVIEGPEFKDSNQEIDNINKLTNFLQSFDLINSFPLIVIADDSEFTSRTIDNFLWITFTRSNPSHDIHGVESFNQYKHWGCKGPLIIDARIKPHHAPPVEDDPRIKKRVDEMGKKGGCLYGII
ncbi:UbiD family decarboxylase [Desulfobacterales bacterium HSG16]|nr:UbiD family decarboxylase [Desulfobacterales bacterium HSG16]